MPCRGDYQDPTTDERESKDICRFILYISEVLKQSVDDISIHIGAGSEYGIVKKLDEYTIKLCGLCRSLTARQKIKVFDIAKKDGRDLADWWEHHQELDEMRAADDKERASLARAKTRALKKLTPLERRALGH